MCGLPLGSGHAHILSPLVELTDDASSVSVHQPVHWSAISANRSLVDLTMGLTLQTLQSREGTTTWMTAPQEALIRTTQTMIPTLSMFLKIPQVSRSVINTLPLHVLFPLPRANRSNNLALSAVVITNLTAALSSQMPSF